MSFEPSAGAAQAARMNLACKIGHVTWETERDSSNHKYQIKTPLLQENTFLLGLFVPEHALFARQHNETVELKPGFDR